MQPQPRSPQQQVRTPEFTTPDSDSQFLSTQALTDKPTDHSAYESLFESNTLQFDP